MIQATVKPKKSNFDMSVSLPADYVGKLVRVLFYIDEEVDSTIASVITGKRPSDFFGILDKEEGKKFEEHAQQLREEWGRNI